MPLCLQDTSRVFSLANMSLLLSPASTPAQLTHPHACTILYHRNAGGHPNTFSSFHLHVCVPIVPFIWICFLSYLSNSYSSFKTQIQWSFLSISFSETLQYFIKSIFSFSKYLSSTYYVPATQGRDYILLIYIVHCSLSISKS